MHAARSSAHTAARWHKMQRRHHGLAHTYTGGHVSHLHANTHECVVCTQAHTRTHSHADMCERVVCTHMHAHVHTHTQCSCPHVHTHNAHAHTCAMIAHMHTRVCPHTCTLMLPEPHLPTTTEEVGRFSPARRGTPCPRTDTHMFGTPGTDTWPPWRLARVPPG